MQKRTILVVDDSKLCRIQVSMILKNEPYELLMAEDGAEGVDRALETQPDLILLDHDMPRMTGFEALERLRATDVTKNIPVIMVTSRSESRDVIDGFKRGCSDYVTKPVDASGLLRRVRSFLSTTS